MEDFQPAVPTYPALNFIVRYGNWVALAAAAAPVVLGGVAWGTGMSPGYGIAGVAAGAFVYLMMRTFVELVRVIVDMLLPK